jgi:low temperature requirement protein LtrA
VSAACHFIVRAVHLALFWVVSWDDPQLRGQIVCWIPSVLAGTVLLPAASQTTGTAQTLLWLAAVVRDYVGTQLAGTRWRLGSAAHFAERHGLIIIVALGESVVSIGIGVAELPISWPIIVASVLGLALVGALWWAYFDVTALLTERALAAARGAHQIRLARGGYTFLHLPMVVGIIMMALGLKKVLGYVGGDEGHVLTDPIYGVPLAALYGGAALYLLAHVGFKHYVAGSRSAARLALIAVVLALIPLVARVPALATLAVLTTLLAALITWETVALRRAPPRGPAQPGARPLTTGIIGLSASGGRVAASSSTNRTRRSWYDSPRRSCSPRRGGREVVMAVGSARGQSRRARWRSAWCASSSSRRWHGPIRNFVPSIGHRGTRPAPP